jgi:hypothetical protein
MELGTPAPFCIETGLAPANAITNNTEFGVLIPLSH